jgi:hypothetical protein
MAGYGTAPRRRGPGLWVTRKGRKLTPAQAAVWEGYYRTGRTDGSGHMKTPSVVQNPTSSRGARRSPPAQPQRTRPPGPTPAKAEKAAAALKAYSKHAPRFEPASTEAEYKRASPRVQKLHRQAVEKQKKGQRPSESAASFFGPLPVGHGFGSRFVSDIGMAITGAPAGAYEIAKAPALDIAHGNKSFPRTRRVGKEILKQTYETGRHPGRHPGYTALLALPGYGAAGKALTVARATRAAEGVLGKTAAAAKATVKPSPVQLRTVKHGGTEIQAPKYARKSTKKAIEQAKEPVEVARFSSRNPITAAAQRAADKRLVARAKAGDKTPGGSCWPAAPLACRSRPSVRSNRRHKRCAR